MSGKLILVPTPIDNETPLEIVACELIKSADPQNSYFCIEEMREGRRRWLRYGLPRERVENFIIYNEHTREVERKNLLKKMQAGMQVFLMSDCGMPAFCDPGQDLVDLCHQNKIPIDSTPFSNSTILAIALSGFNLNQFYFQGFLPRQDDEREELLKIHLQKKEGVVIMETPYRYKKLIAELNRISCHKSIFIGVNLNMPDQLIFRGEVAKAPKNLKAPFVLILSPRQ